MTDSRKSEMKKGSLYVIATPIGHLDDITLRAIDFLKRMDIIACEDTRQTRKLLNRYGIKAKVMSYHKFNELRRSEDILELLEKGKKVALVSDAGTPGISDPGYLLVRLVLEKDFAVIPVPGPSALTAILSISGLPLHSFSFYGFLPKKKGEKRKFLNSLRYRKETLIFFESPHRVVESLSEMFGIFGPRKIVIGREMTKIHEETIRGALQDVLENLKKREAARRKGEFALLVEGAKKGEAPHDDTSVYEYYRELVEEAGLSRKEAIKTVSKEKGLPKRQVYREILEQEGK
jgi:16S rRNA (cytidine1402-2'-O)-methyltransferase